MPIGVSSERTSNRQEEEEASRVNTESSALQEFETGIIF